MQEIAPGLWHWTARHERIHAGVSSYYLLAERVLIDAMVPAEGLSWFEEHGVPEHVLLTNRHHDRYAWRLRDAFGDLLDFRDDVRSIHADTNKKVGFRPLPESDH